MKTGLTLFALLVCLICGLIAPQIASSTVYVDQSFCLYCHKHDSKKYMINMMMKNVTNVTMVHLQQEM